MIPTRPAHLLARFVPAAPGAPFRSAVGRLTCVEGSGAYLWVGDVLVVTSMGQERVVHVRVRWTDAGPVATTLVAATLDAPGSHRVRAPLAPAAGTSRFVTGPHDFFNEGVAVAVEVRVVSG